MKYYSLEFGINETVLGNREQVKSYENHCHIWEDPLFIDRFVSTKIDLMPKLSVPVLQANSKITDFITTTGIGFSDGSMVFNSKIKKIFEQHNCYAIQFFPTYLLKKSLKHEDYFQNHFYDCPYQELDFKKTEIFLKNSESRKVDFAKRLEISDVKEFKATIESLSYPNTLSIKNAVFIDSMNYDFFRLLYFENGGVRGIVSNNLKNELERQGCSGIEFRPIDLSLETWYASSERENKYGKP